MAEIQNRHVQHQFGVSFEPVFGVSIEASTHDRQMLVYVLKLSSQVWVDTLCIKEIAAGRLNAVKSGRKSLIREEDVKVWRSV